MSNYISYQPPSYQPVTLTTSTYYQPVTLTASTYYNPSTTITSDTIFSDLEKLELKEYVGNVPAKKARCLTDGQNYLWVYSTATEYKTTFARYGTNDVKNILNILRDHFNIKIKKRGF